MSSAPRKTGARAVRFGPVQNEGIQLRIPRNKAAWIYWALDVMERQARTGHWRHLQRARRDRRECVYLKNRLMDGLAEAEEGEVDDIALSAYPVTGRYWWAALTRAGLHEEAEKLASAYAEGGAHLVRDLEPAE